MKSAIIGICCFVIAFVMGRMGPQSELRTSELQVAALKEALAEQESNRRALAGVTGMLRIGAAADPAGPVENARLSLPEPDAAASPDPETPQPVVDSDAPESTSMEQRIDTAVELWESRSRLARATLLANVEAGPETARQFDVLMAAMNLRIQDSMARWVDGIEVRGQVRPEDGARLMHELTGAVVFTYDELDESLPEGWRQQAGRDFQLFDFIDPNAGRDLLRIEGLMEDRPQRRLF